MDAERALFSGVTVDRKRFRREIEMFHKRPNDSSTTNSTRSVENSARDGAACSRHDHDEQHPSEAAAVAVASAGASASASAGQRATSGSGSGSDLGDMLPALEPGEVRGGGSGSDIGAPQLHSRDPVEYAQRLRRQFHIHVSHPSTTPPPLTSFEELQSIYRCSPRLLSSLSSFGFTQPTPIQRQAMPLLLKHRDCFACAPTGSGKTVAFLLPILAALKSPSKKPGNIRAVILSPTRELALQTTRVLVQLATPLALSFRLRLLTRSTDRCVDLRAVRCDVLLATPERLSRQVEQGKVDLSSVLYLILDEADRLFDFNFIRGIDSLLAACSHPRLTRCCFSATLPDAVELTARQAMTDPVRVVVGGRNAAAESVRQRLVFVGSEEGKLLAMRQAISEGICPPVLIFVQSKERAEQLFSELRLDRLPVDVIHADKSAAQRSASIDRLRSGAVWFLIATDLLGRGMDILGVKTVVNYDMPATAAAYVHRIGRSGRAGASGSAISFYTAEDEPNLRAIARVVAASASSHEEEEGEEKQTAQLEWMKQLPRRRDRKRVRGMGKKLAEPLPPKRQPISSVPGAASWKNKRAGNKKA